MNEKEKELESKIKIYQNEQLTTLKFRNQQLLDELRTERSVNEVHGATINRLIYIISKHRDVDFLGRLKFLFTGVLEE